ncbi:leucine-rich repeat-containing protein 31 [Gouania willdenowi]|uniref:Leucine rich repeat containing 31 n=1 Tax=Gouania willdenowi TaxID=441366 RepID=A0A8C5GTK4_GOUWI|nr:leucine-rich repeat-containing protein 31 [Gouania willdenowi]
MDSADGQRGRDQRRSPLDAIMSQIRRKRVCTDRKSMNRLLIGSERPQISQEGAKEAGSKGSAGGSGVDSQCVVGWGQVCVFLQKFGKNADSRNLSVSHCDLTSTELLELALLLQFLPQLDQVDASWNELIGGSLMALTSHLQHVGGVRTLKLCSCRLNNDDITALGEALSSLPHLELLDLSWNSSVGGGALKGLLGKVPPTLKELHLLDCRLTAADASVLGRILCSVPGLRVLDTSCNPRLAQEVEAFKELADGLSHSPSLSELRFHSCGLTGDSMDALSGPLRCSLSLRHLDLSCNKHLATHLGRLTPHLWNLTHLQSLDLHQCSLSLTDLQHLIQVLPLLTALTEFDVSSNQEVGGVVNQLVSALSLTQMRRFPLNNCSITQESYTSLALVVPYLCSVDVSWSKVVGGRLPLLLDALQLSVIQELRLCSCDLTTSDLLHLASVSGRGFLSSLLLLQLSCNGSVGDDGWAALFSAPGLSSLRELDVSRPPGPPARCSAWLPALLGALTRMEALTQVEMRRWTAAPEERRRLEAALRKRSVVVEWERGEEVDQESECDGHAAEK